MSITPRGMSIQEAYRLYRDDKIEVNRKYQRKLVWTLEEKQSLIDSIINDYPIPLILLAEEKGKSRYEILDGMQRLNAIFSYIENGFALNGEYFDVREFSRAKQAQDAGLFPALESDIDLLAPDKCANYLDYQLAVTIFPAEDDAQVTDVFARINSGGRQLSWQEKRQAGMTDSFSNLVRVISSEVRGDSSQDTLPLADMPEISIDSSRLDLGYKLKAEEIFWCKQGVLWVKQLRDSEDEEMIADVIASLIFGSPIAKSKDLLDDIYNSETQVYKDIRSSLATYGENRVRQEIKVTFSVLNEIIENVDSGQNALRRAINPKSTNPIKAAFFSLFLALHEIVVKEEKTPDNYKAIMDAISGLQRTMRTTAKYSKTDDRVRNVSITKGLIQKFFVKKDPPLLKHGAGLALDLENSLRRSKIETSRYECKQGIVDLSPARKQDKKLLPRVIETICGIANVGPDENGFLFLGVADNQADSDRIKDLDDIKPVKVGERYVVGIDRELGHLGCDLESYVAKVLSAVRESQLSEPLKSQILSQVDTIEYRGNTVIRVRVPKQKEVSFVGDIAYVREGSSTVEATGKKLLAVNSMFS
ncbi:DUF262 domain-containing protein [Marinobacter sp. HL-58]|uniref:GmrSD restriction endonuclease domain-containing protein n=1 Tax=Marinobacter sp. HL-58 TaxID=1479237 RepID=UPI000489A39C|nr:DUF262 domain-containing protein [Marinobacter sp. HL-58]KPP97676.1 MAG: hypothetical protein HLUCCO03_10895 [Marinobacter sp. HL-58]